MVTADGRLRNLMRRLDALLDDEGWDVLGDGIGGGPCSDLRRADVLQANLRAFLMFMDYSEYLRTEHWRETRAAALARAGGRCQLCNAGGRALDVHHRTYERRGHEAPDDLIALCRECHSRFHGKGA